MLEIVSIFLSIITFIIGIIKLWGIDEFEELSLTLKERTYKKVLSFFKVSISSFFYLMLLGVYYHTFNLFVNDYAIYYFIILLFVTILLYLVIIVFWIFSKSEKNIIDEHKKEFKIIMIFNRLTFVYLCIAVWLHFASQIGLDNYQTFYSAENLANVASLSAVLAVVIYFLSIFLSKFYELMILNKIYYFDDYPSHSIKKIQENEYYLLKDLEGEEYIYLDFKKMLNSKIKTKIISKINLNNFVFTFIVFIFGIFIFLISVLLIIIKLLVLIDEFLFDIMDKVLDYLRKRNEKWNKMDIVLLSTVNLTNQIVNKLNKIYRFIISKIEKLTGKIKYKLSCLAEKKDN